MKIDRQPRSDRRLVSCGWLALLIVLAFMPGAGRARGEPADELPRPAFRDTTGQADLRWLVDRPQRRASLYQADRTVYRIIDGEAVSFHYGNVYIDRDTVVVRADSAHAYDERGLVRLFDNVRLRQHDTRISCDWAEYRRVVGEADLRGRVYLDEEGVLATAHLGELRDDMQLLRLFENAVLITPEYTVLADTLLRDRRLPLGEAFGHVRITDPNGGSLVTGDHGRFASDGTWAEVDRNPTLETQEEGQEPVHSVAGGMTFFRAEERVVMTDSVRIRQGHLRAYADTAISYGKEHMVLLGSPRLEQGARSTMTGQEIEFYYRQGELYRVIMVGDARIEDTEPDSLAAIYRGLPPLAIIEGDSITVHFLRGEIQRTDVVGDAHSIYVPVDVEDEVAFNDVQGDTLVLRFREQRVREVEVRGSMSGKYRYANIAAMRGLVVPDSAAVDSLASTLPDSAVAADSLTAAEPDTFSFTAHAQDVDYSGRTVRFDLARHTIDISEDAKLVYGTMILSARDVIMDTDSRELYADGDPLLEDNEVIAGDQMGYDFGNKTGAVRGGVTDFDGFFYVGDTINRYPDGSLKICSGKMTSCDRPEPHFHFWSNKMKMRLGDKVVAAPIVLKIGKVPIFALPFYFKSLKEGRRSGILFPNFNFGWSSREGRYIRDFGYYWAVNDYTDLTFEIDYNERRELSWSVRNRYNKRYSFDGNVEYSALRSLRSDQDLREWQLAWNHSQPKLFDDYNFRARVQMASKELSRNDLNSDTGRDILDSELTSDVTVSRRFGFGGLSFSASRSEYTNAADDDPATDKQIYNMTLPSLSLSVKQINLGRELGSGEDGSLLGDLARATDFSQSYSASSRRSATEETSTAKYAARGTWGLTTRTDRIWIFNPNLSARGSLAWDRSEESGRSYDLADSVYYDLDETSDESRPTLSFSSGVSTKLYGIFPLRLGALQAIRHTLSLSASATYTPELGSKQSRGQSYGFNLGNKFDAKYLAAGEDDSTATTKKLDNVLAWDLSTRYNPDVDKMWGDISSGVTIRPGKNRNLNFRLQNSIDPYAWALKSTTFNYSFGFDGKLDTGFTGLERVDEQNLALARVGAAMPDSAAADSSEFAGQWDEFDGPVDELPVAPRPGEDRRVAARGAAAGNQRDETEGGRFIPWTLGGNVSLNHTRGRDLTSRGSLQMSTKITRDWSFNYSASFDFRTGSTLHQQYRLQRDVHCWRLEFMRTVSTGNSEFGFRFYLLSIPELKLTRGKDDMLGMARGLSSGLGMSGF